MYYSSLYLRVDSKLPENFPFCTYGGMVDALRGQDERRLIQGERGVLVVSCSHCSQLAVTLRLLLDHRDDRWRAEHSVPPPWSVTRVFVCNMPLSHYSMVLAHHRLKVFQ